MKKALCLFTLSAVFLVISQKSASGQSASHFINEINYLASNPSNRGLEIAGAAGSSLDGWSAVAYQANGAAGAVEYFGNALIPSQQNGYGTIWYDVEQTGGGGGFALVRPDGSVAQFLSFGMALVIYAASGPAAGMTSQFAGLQVLPSKSLQLVGTGTGYLDFLWALPGNATKGGVNINQFFPPLLLAAPDDDNSPATAQAEFGDWGIEGLSDSGAGESEALEVSAYPVPVASRLQVRLSGALPQDASVRLLDFSGRLLETAVLEENAAEIDMSHLPAGSYLLAVEGAPSKVILKK